MKKLLLGTVAALSVATFQTAQAQETDLNGFYAGFYGGYTWADTENSRGADPSPSGTDYGVYGGYKIDSMLESTGLGITGALEGHWGGSTADDTVGGVKIEKGREFGLSFRPGLTFLNSDAIFDINPYAILGYRNTEFEASVVGLTADETYHGFELGIGTELVAYDNMGIRFDYTHVFYGEENNIDPSEDNFRIGIGYNF